jgi:hypothetical protein
MFQGIVSDKIKKIEMAKYTFSKHVVYLKVFRKQLILVEKSSQKFQKLAIIQGKI